MRAGPRWSLHRPGRSDSRLRGGSAPGGMRVVPSLVLGSAKLFCGCSSSTFPAARPESGARMVLLFTSPNGREGAKDA